MNTGGQLCLQFDAFSQGARIHDSADSRHMVFLHSAFCQATLPHARPKSNDAPWTRRSGRMRLTLRPGSTESSSTGVLECVGVPYGTRARLIMIYLQSQVASTPHVELGRSMSAWMRSLGISVTGGPRGTIASVKEQLLRIALCRVELEWTTMDKLTPRDVAALDETSLVRGLSDWAMKTRRDAWPEEIELSSSFAEHLRNHAVPLDKRAIAELSDTCMGLDLYAFAAYRLHKLERPLKLPWRSLMEQFGSETSDSGNFAKQVRHALSRVRAVYPRGRIEPSRFGLTLYPSAPPIARRIFSLGKISAP